MPARSTCRGGADPSAGTSHRPLVNRSPTSASLVASGETTRSRIFGNVGRVSGVIFITIAPGSFLSLGSEARALGQFLGGEPGRGPVGRERAAAGKRDLPVLDALGDPDIGSPPADRPGR